MNRREFVQQYVLVRVAKRDGGKEIRDNAAGIADDGNFVYDIIEQHRQIAADNSMPDSRQYLDTVTERLTNGKAV